MTFNYKEYSLENLENWMHDAMSSAEATPQEIYDVIVGVVRDNYYTYKAQTENAYELLELLNGSPLEKHSKYYYDYDRNKPVKKTCDKDDPSPECKGAWNDFWEEHYTDEEMDAMCAAAEKTDEVKKWVLPVEEVDCDECIINLPDDLLEAANLKEGDEIEWVDNGDGSYFMKKITKKGN
jgi:hypothetical protein